MEIIKDSKENIENKSIEIIKNKINQLDKVILGIPGGRSVQGLFEKLKTADLDWNKIHIFMVDERFVDITDDQSNYKGAESTFIKQLVEEKKLSSQNLHPFIYDKAEEDGGVEYHNEEFLHTSDHFDIIILGAGEDGHCASLFPKHDSIKNPSSNFIKVDNSPKPPPTRISASKKLLQSAETSILLFLGEGKKEAFEKFQDDSVSVEDCPCKLVKEIKDSFVFSDIGS